MCGIHINVVACRIGIRLFRIRGVIGTGCPKVKNGKRVDLSASVIVVRIKRATQDELTDRIAPNTPIGHPCNVADDRRADTVQRTIGISSGRVIPIVAHIKTPVRVAGKRRHVVDVFYIVDRSEG